MSQGPLAQKRLAFEVPPTAPPLGSVPVDIMYAEFNTAAPLGKTEAAITEACGALKDGFS
jgi:hypothetical protein